MDTIEVEGEKEENIEAHDRRRDRRKGAGRQGCRIVGWSQKYDWVV